VCLIGKLDTVLRCLGGANAGCAQHDVQAETAGRSVACLGSGVLLSRGSAQQYGWGGEAQNVHLARII
jgi:hypothetical protein